MKLLVHGGCVSQNPVGRFCNQLVEAIYWRISCLSDCHRQISVTGDPVVLSGLVDLSCLLPMGTTDFFVTGEPAVSTGMVGADLSVTGKFSLWPVNSVTGEPAVSTGMMGAADLSVTGKFSVTRFLKKPGSVWLIYLYFLPVNRSGGLCNRPMGSTLVKEGYVAGTQWVGSVTGIVGSINSVAWTASWSNFYNRFPVGPILCNRLVDLTLNLSQYPYQGRVKGGGGGGGGERASWRPHR